MERKPKGEEEDKGVRENAGIDLSSREMVGATWQRRKQLTFSPIRFSACPGLWSWARDSLF